MALAKEKLIQMYREMLRIRTFDERVAKEFITSLDSGGYLRTTTLRGQR